MVRFPDHFASGGKSRVIICTDGSKGKVVTQRFIDKAPAHSCSVCGTQAVAL